NDVKGKAFVAKGYALPARYFRNRTAGRSPPPLPETFSPLLPEIVTQADLDFMRAETPVAPLYSRCPGQCGGIVPTEHVPAVDVTILVANVELEVPADVIGDACHQRIGESPVLLAGMAGRCNRGCRGAVDTDAVGGVLQVLPPYQRITQSGADIGCETGIGAEVDIAVDHGPDGRKGGAVLRATGSGSWQSGVARVGAGSRPVEIGAKAFHRHVAAQPVIEMITETGAEGRFRREIGAVKSGIGV